MLTGFTASELPSQLGFKLYKTLALLFSALSEEPVIEPDPESPQDCPMSQWLDWSSCEGICQDGKLTGYRWRERYHLVDGVAVEKYNPDVSEYSACNGYVSYTWVLSRMFLNFSILRL